jgi:hypothetical protein
MDSPVATRTPGEPVSPSQTGSSGHTPTVSTPPLSVGQDPIVTRNLGVGAPPVAGTPWVPPEAAGNRAPGGRPAQPGAGGRVGSGPVGVPANEMGAGRGARGAVAGHPGGFVPAGARASGEEDQEHTNKYGPIDWHDDVFADIPAVAPPVIGLEEEE